MRQTGGWQRWVRHGGIVLGAVLTVCGAMPAYGGPVTAGGTQPSQGLPTAENVAAQITDVLPQGRVSAVEAVQVRFSAPAMAFGDPDAPAPVRLVCAGPVPPGQGRWLDDLRWTYVFERTLPAGVRCDAEPDPGFRDLNDQPLQAGRRYSFNTGAPTVTDMRPYAGATIDEEQVFILRFDAPVDTQQVAAHSHCVVQGLAEKIPTQAVGGEHLEPLMQAAYLPPPDDPASVSLLRCARVLPPEAQVRLEIGPGIQAVGQPATLAASAQAQVLEYEVRPPFMARLTCTRERAGRPCLPVTPVNLTFTAPVARDQIRQIRLAAGDALMPAALPEYEDDPGFVSSVTFPGPFPPQSALMLSLPSGLRDDAGRLLENADSFPLKVDVADYPPLAKFASGTFGVIERFAQAPPGVGKSESAAVPVTLRHVEARPVMRDLRASSGRVGQLRSIDDADVLRWYARLQRLDSGRWSDRQVQDILAGRAPRPLQDDSQASTDSRAVSALKDQPAVRYLDLPAAPEGGLYPFEVIGVPLDDPGFHILEIESPRLGESLLEDGSTMYVRSGVLLTNLSVHLKQGQDDLLVWVTTLADSRPVPDAEITVLDCDGRQLLRGQSDADGLWHHLAAVEAESYCEETGLSGLFVSARIDAGHPQAHGKADYAFVMSDWDRGIENWRFNVPVAYDSTPERLTHTVFDRSLFQTGETVSMKHYLREETRNGLKLPPHERPDRLVIEHEGSAFSHELPVSWNATPSGGLAALSQFPIPDSAYLGAYSVRLTDAEHRWYGSSRFRVEAFRLPLLGGQLAIRGEDVGARADLLVAPRRLAVDLQLAWLSGGAASGQQVSLSAVAQERDIYMENFDGYSFSMPSLESEPGIDAEAWPGSDAAPRRQLFLDSASLTLDAHGMATVDIESVPVTDRPRRFVFEAGFSDPNGEIQTLSQAVDIWPAGVQAGIRAESWGRAGQDIPISLIALGTDAQPQAGVAMRLIAVERRTYSVRKRMVGGFYRYDSHTERRETGTLCTGMTDADGRLACTARFNESASFDLVAIAEDDKGRLSQAATSLWVSGAAESWFGGADDDRIDLIPAKREWSVGEEAEFQVRMPFREALALVSVEREGVLWTRQVELKGTEPVIRLPVSANWGPNAYVSVLVLRGRLYELPWKSLLEWGWRRPQAWLQAWRENPGDTQVSSTVDLARPAFRLGLAELRVAPQGDRLTVEVTPEKPVLHVRESTRARVKVSLPDGRPAAQGSVVFAVVDEALLELASNESWALYEAMHPRRSLRVSTATSQLEVVGRRHYGRKAVAAGGGGGNMPTRQLFDTLISWQPSVMLDDNGEAEVSFRMNDALSRFRLVAVADHGPAFFGTATATVATRQDLQLVSGLPPVVRHGDHYQVVVTLRNGTGQTRTFTVRATHDGFSEPDVLPAKTLSLEPGAAGSVAWAVTAGRRQGSSERASAQWRFEATDGGVSDSLSVAQVVEPRIPLTTVQASLLGLEAGAVSTLPVQAPPTAQQGRDGRLEGGIALDVSASLVGSLESVGDWWRAYPYTCLEQSASQAMALNDAQRWAKVVMRLGTHMDDDGLLRYFAGPGQGSEVLTAYLVSMIDDARRLGLPLSVPEDLLERMLDGLQAFAQGRISRERRSTGASLDSRRLMVMEALARHGRVNPAMLASLSGAPAQWPTPTVVDWLSVLSRLPETPARQQGMALARSLLVARMTVSGTTLVFSDMAINGAPALMASRATSQARLMLTVMDDPHWQRDLPGMAQGLLSLQQQGVWAMTTENLLGILALTGYARRFEAQPVSGVLRASMAGARADISAPAPGTTQSRLLPWAAESGPAELRLQHEGQGRVWVGLRAQASVPVLEARESGYRLERRVVPVQRRNPQGWTRGDIYRVEIDIHARDSSTWVVLNDPVPAGATILGSGLGRDSLAGQPAPDASYSPAFVERTATGYRAYFDYLPAGRVRLAYTVRLNATGDFGLPPSRVEALYRPDLYGVFPNNEGMHVEQGDDDPAGRP